MAQFETLGILEEVGALVSDRLQVVSYKWLSRNYLLSSNTAKKLLQDFVKKHKHELEVVYTVAGRLKKTPSTYHITAVPAPKLVEAKQNFQDDCSVEVYSVQASIPKDPAAIWNAEFIQTEELFTQDPTVDNCLRDNRFSGISNSLVKRNFEGAPSAIVASHTKTDGNSGLATGRSTNQVVLNQSQPKKLQQSSPKLAVPSSSVIPAVTTNKGPSSHDLLAKGISEKENNPAVKKDGQSNKTTTATGGSLSSFWGRAATKSKANNSLEENKTAAQMTNVSADAQICTHEALETMSSDDDKSDVNFKRASNRDGGKKRRIVLDDSDDEYENAVNLGSPEFSKGQLFQDSKQKNQTLVIEKNTLNFDDHEECKVEEKEETTADEMVNNVIKDSWECKLNGKEEKPADEMVDNLTKKDSTAGKSVEISAPMDIQDKPSNADHHKSSAADGASSSPKRRKVLKTRIDERGREVTEVVWEGEETNSKDMNEGKSSHHAKNSVDHPVKVEDSAATKSVNRAATLKKSSANSVPSHTAGKPGSKKGAGAKTPKQGNIMSFFKKV